MLLKLDFLLKDLSGNIITDESIAKILANAIFFGQCQNPLRMRNIAQKLFDTGCVEIDKRETNALQEFVETNNNFTVCLKAVILDAIEDARLACQDKTGEEKTNT